MANGWLLKHGGVAPHHFMHVSRSMALFPLNSGWLLPSEQPSRSPRALAGSPPIEDANLTSRRRERLVSRGRSCLLSLCLLFSPMFFAL